MSEDQRSVRLGDVVDDYCPRCRLIMNHGVVSIVEEAVKKVRCNTCLFEHLFRHGRLPARRKNTTGKLFEEVLKGMPGAGSPAPPESPEPPPKPVNPQRKLYTIRRSISGKDSDKGPGRKS